MGVQCILIYTTLMDLSCRLQEEQAAQLQAQVSVKERFITTLRRTITTSGADTNSPLSGQAS